MFYIGIVRKQVLSMDAARAFARTWPEGSGSEGANFNRCFPGQPGGDTAQQLAYFVSHVLFPGGPSLPDSPPRAPILALSRARAHTHTLTYLHSCSPMVCLTDVDVVFDLHTGGNSMHTF